MTYASISEAWGGVSGSNQLNTSMGPLHQRMHPIHLKRIAEEKKKEQNMVPSWKTNKDLYQCNYGSHKCNDIFKQNQEFNNNKKRVAQGMQPFLPPSAGYPGSPPPHNYTFMPQYPWYPWAKYGYLGYGPGVSSMWYNNPSEYNPGVANQIAQHQMFNPTPTVPIQTPYQPNGFFPQQQNTQPPQMNPMMQQQMMQQQMMNPMMHPMMQQPMMQQQMNPQMHHPMMQNRNQNINQNRNQNRNQKKKESFQNIEHFGQQGPVKTAMIFFIFFLVALAVILCIFMLAMSQTKK